MTISVRRPMRLLVGVVTAVMFVVGCEAAVATASGQGDGQLEFRATAKRNPATREGDIVVNDARIRVVPDAAPCVFDVRPGNLAVGAAGGTISVSVSANDRCSWTATSHASWIEVDSPGGGSGSGPGQRR
jgi:hypothetical protein